MCVNTQHNVYQQFTPLVTMYTTKYNPERFITVSKQDDEVLHSECRLTLEDDSGLMASVSKTLNLFFFNILGVVRLQDQMPTQ